MHGRVGILWDDSVKRDSILSLGRRRWTVARERTLRSKRKEQEKVGGVRPHLRRPGIEPGPPAWQASILPLNQRRTRAVAMNTPLDLVFLGRRIWIS